MGRKTLQKFMATEAFIEAVNNFSSKNNLPKWKIAALADTHPSILSRIMNGKVLDKFEAGKGRDIAQKIGFEGKCFRSLEEFLSHNQPGVP